jgi:hypothetical protein
MQCLVVNAYLLHFKPFADPFTNWLEVINESCILSVAYPALLYTGGAGGNYESL